MAYTYPWRHSHQKERSLAAGEPSHTKEDYNTINSPSTTWNVTHFRAKSSCQNRPLTGAPKPSGQKNPIRGVPLPPHLMNQQRPATAQLRPKPSPETLRIVETVLQEVHRAAMCDVSEGPNESLTEEALKNVAIAQVHRTVAKSMSIRLLAGV